MRLICCSLFIVCSYLSQSLCVHLGTPFNYSRRESLSSLSCDDDDDDDDEINITIINRVNEAMLRKMHEAKAQAGAGGPSAALPTFGTILLEF